MNLVLKGDLSQGTRSSQTVQVPIEKVTKLLTNLSTEFSTVKINNLDPDVLDQLKPNTSNKLT
ncbi:hypothetical protein, partial [Acinetobacter baumannii]|uniref:hypothetical protein n=1 Tax=Acinetobacter baumannii TaxID=470 RepID=UPI001CB7B5F5